MLPFYLRINKKLTCVYREHVFLCLTGTIKSGPFTAFLISKRILKVFLFLRVSAIFRSTSAHSTRILVCWPCIIASTPPGAGTGLIVAEKLPLLKLNLVITGWRWPGVLLMEPGDRKSVG